MSKGNYISFIVGAAIGSAVTWYYAKRYYEERNREDIESVKSVFTYKKDNKAQRNSDVHDAELVRTIMTSKAVILDDDADAPININIKPDIMNYAAKIKNEKYVDYSTSTKTNNEVKLGETHPYVISPDEYGEYDDYSKISFMYYADHILCDELDQIVDNIDELIGIESLSTFGLYDDDSVYVRNDERKTDYEILRSLRTYSEVIEESPYKAEV